MKKLTVFLLLLVSLMYITCSSFYIPIWAGDLGVSGYDYVGWRDYAWQQQNPNGVCTHLATYETQLELDQIISSIEQDASGHGEGISYATYFAAQKDENSNLFYWAVGSRRGQAFFSASQLATDPYHNGRYLDINFESGFICHQEFCFDQAQYYGVLKYDSFTNAVLFIGGDDSYYVYSDYYELADYGVLEYESSSIYANAEGGSKFIVSKAFLSYTESNLESNVAGTYVARIETAKQQQWILDELQCTNSEIFWLGYQKDVATGDYIKGPGPGEGQTLYNSVTGCTRDLYCNYQGSKKRSVTELPGIPPKFGLALDTSQGGKWIEYAEGTAARYLSQAEFCSFNADQFFRHNFKLDNQVRVCLPNPSNNWIAARSSIDGNHGYFTEKTFFAGAGVYFSNPENGAKKLLYFDCDCNTNPIVDKSCLGGSDFPDCVLYTNNPIYYQLGLYYQRLKFGLAYSFDRIYEYFAWYYLYEYFE